MKYVVVIWDTIFNFAHFHRLATHNTGNVNRQT